ncbi:hypothetical protein [Kibdelosporangium philippinense]|uniref:hypothetical protein n=1 Tax=Kibdelosporangium philippinense TaxID=211113 RepID=UPI0036081619
MMVIRAEDIADALTRRDDSSLPDDGERDGETTGTRGVLPAYSLTRSPRPDVGKPRTGRANAAHGKPAETPESGTRPPSLGDIPGSPGESDGTPP